MTTARGGRVVDTSIGGHRLVWDLDALVARRGKPAMIVSDNGTQMTSRALLELSNCSGVAWHYIAPGESQQNGFVESSNGKFRASARMGRCSPTWPRPVLSSNAGGWTTIIWFGRIRRMGA